MSTASPRAHNGADTPITTLPVSDEEATPYLPHGLRYQRLYQRLRTEGVSVAEALLATLKVRHLALSAGILEYEVTHLVTP